MSNAVSPRGVEHVIGNAADPSQGIYGSIDNIISMLKNMFSEIRDMQREHFSAQQGVAFQKELTALATKEASIERNYTAASKNGAIKIVSGGASIAGAGFAGVSKFEGYDIDEIITSGMNGIGKAGEGAVAMACANITRDAQLTQAKGEFQANTATEYYKSLATVAEKAAEASRQMLEMTRELMSLQERITSAVRL